MTDGPGRGLETKLWAALNRIKNAEKLENSALRERAKTSPVRLSVSNVAREAGCSRTLIGHDGCAYPDIRQAIIGDRKIEHGSKRRSISPQEANRKLREEVRELERLNQVLATRLNDALAKVRDADRRLMAERQRAERASNHASFKPGPLFSA